ncbi:MAG: small basic protein, partial [Arcticibacterium sp.]
TLMEHIYDSKVLIRVRLFSMLIAVLIYYFGATELVANKKYSSKLCSGQTLTNLRLALEGTTIRL